MKDVKIGESELATTLSLVDEPVAIWGPKGNVIGYFTPAKQSLRHVEIPFSEEQLKAWEADVDGKHYTAAEVEAKLKEWRCTT